jgi:amidohydrolase
MTNIADLKQCVIAAIDGLRDELIQLSAAIHSGPELAFKEFDTARRICAALEHHGFQITRGVGGIETSFWAELRGSDQGPTIAFLAEYDALPELGHACGHNIVAASAVGGAVALQEVTSVLPGRIVVIGTPAEESGGGKVIMLEHGVFDSVDATLLVHPAARTMVTRGSLASVRLDVEFFGKAAHAAAAPEDGINALEALLAMFHSVNAMRLHLKSDARVHGIITHGGTAANVIPDYAAGKFSIRAATQAYADEIFQRVVQCGQAGATATEAEFKYKITGGSADIVVNRTLARAFADNWRTLGIEIQEPRQNERMGSTDHGNVSHKIPSIHPYIQIAPPGTAGHTVAFRQAAISENGNLGLLNGAKGMAMTAIDLMYDEKLMQAVKDEHAAVCS